MHGTVASTDSTRRRRRRSATARTRSAACASATARPTPRRSADWQALRDELDAQDRGANDRARARSDDGRRWTAPRTPPRPAPTTPGDGRSAATSRRLTDRPRRPPGRAGQARARRADASSGPGCSSSAATPRSSPRSAAPAIRGRRPDAHRRGPGGRALPPRPGDPRRTGPGARQRDLPGRVHRAGPRVGPAARPDRAALPARAAAPRARRRPGVHQPAPPAAARPARAGRGDRRHRRAHARR